MNIQRILCATGEIVIDNSNTQLSSIKKYLTIGLKIEKGLIDTEYLLVYTVQCQVWERMVRKYQLKRMH